MTTTTQERLPLAGVENGVEHGVEDGAGWRLDERTREVGRRGLAEARAALAEAARRAAAREARAADPAAHRHAA
ncbi:MAG: hypothetical protein NVSMB12_17000 [Acidimicrobiales bacterium]